MRKRVPARAKHIMIEEGPPGVAFLGRPFGDRDHRQHHRDIMCVRPLHEGIPPIIDEEVRRLGRLNLVPPQLRKIDRIDGQEFGDQRLIPYLFEARVPRIVLRTTDRERDGLTGHGEVYRADIETAD